MRLFLLMVRVLLLGLLIKPVLPVLADHSPGDPETPFLAVDYEQKLEAQAPLDLNFVDDSGQSVQLEQYFGKRPVILVFAYYECPMLCTRALNSLTGALKALAFTPGNEFEILTVSIDPGEGPELAASKKASYLDSFGRPDAARGWHFLTGRQNEIAQLAQAVGFQYVYDSEKDEYAHPTGIVLLTPRGIVSSYLLGIDYSPTELRLGLVEASENKIGSPVDQFFLLCYAYDPVHGRYTLMIENILRLAGLATVAAIGGLVILLKRRESASTLSTAIQAKGKEIP